MAMKIEQIAELCIGEIDIDEKTLSVMLDVLDEISALCTVKAGTPEEEIAEIEDKAGITLSKEQKEKISKKYKSVINVPEGNEKAVSMIGIQARSIKRFLQVVTQEQ